MRFKNIIIGIVLFLIVFFVSLVVWLHYNGRSFVERRASLMLRRPVTVERVTFGFPLGLRLTDLNVEGLLWADQVDVQGGPLNVFGRKFRLARVTLVNPILTLHRTKDRQIIWAEDDTLSSSTGKKSPAPADMRSVEALIGMLTVVNGRIHFPNHASEDGPVEFSMSRVELTAKNVPLSGQAQDFGFDVLGRIEGAGIPFSGNSVKGSGWINWPARNMDATIGIVNAQGKIDVEVNLSAKNNDMMVRGHVKTRRMALKSDENNDVSMEHLLLEAIQSAGMEINLDFSLQTKMDQWELRNIDFSGNLNASDEGKTSGQKLEDLKNIGQQFKSVGEQIYDKYKKE